MRHVLVIVALFLGAFSVVQPAAADHKPWIRVHLSIPIERIFDDGVVYVSGRDRYWVPDGYRDYRECKDRRHRRGRHAHVYYDPDRWSEDHWREDRWRKERWSDEDSDSDSDSDRRKHRRQRHHRHYHSYRDYGHRHASGVLELVIPLN